MKKLQIMFFFIAVSAVLFSCQNDESIEHNHSEQKISIQRKTFDKFEKLSALTEKLMTNTDLNRSGADSLYDFVIDSSMVTQAIAGQKTTYTMAIKRPISIEGTFENLIITDSVNINRAYIIKYTPSELYYARLQSNAHAPYIGNIIVQELNYDQLQQKGMSCTTLQFTFCNYQYIHRAGKLCTNTYTAGVTFCFNDISTSFVDVSDLVHSGNGGGGGNSDNPQDPYNPVTPGPTNPWDTNPEGDDSSPTITEPVIFDAAIRIFKQSLNAAQLSWWNNVANNSKMQMLKTHLETNSFSDESENFTRWAIEYLRTHTNTTIAQFKNWFLTPREGNDGDYDAAFWENPNLSFEPQDLPSWADFESAYPRGNGSDLVQLIGGPIQQAYNQYPDLSRGYCALKVSRALNYSGITIPQITTTSGKPGTVQGSDGKYYFLNAKALNAWMRETFGTNPDNPNHHHFTAEDGGVSGENFPTLVTGMKGIYSMVTDDPDHIWASGHADLINNNQCVFGCHFNDVPAGMLDHIDIWVLN